MKKRKIQEKQDIPFNFYSLTSAVFIIYISSLLISYLIYGFISYQFRIFDFISENAPLEHPVLFVLLVVFIFILFYIFLYFDRKRFFILILHIFSFLLYSFIFIQINRGRWFEYENTLYVIISILLLSLYFAWLVKKLQMFKINELILKLLPLIFITILIVYFFYFSFLAIERHNRFYSQLYDLGWEHQVLHNLSKSGIPYSTIESKEGIINWADHTSFIYYLIVPFYKIFPDVRLLFFIQTFSVCLATFFIYLLSSIIFKNKLYAIITSIIFLFHPSVQGILLEDFHPSVLAFPLFFLLFLFIENKNSKAAFIISAILCAVREEFIFFTFFIYIFLFASGKIDIKKTITGILIVVLFAIISYRVMKLSGGGISDYDRFYFITNKFWGVIALIFVNPFFIFGKLFDMDKINFILISSLPLLFLFFLNKKNWIILLPSFIFTIFSKHLPHYLTGYHYSVMFICAAFAGFIYYFENKKNIPSFIISSLIAIIFFINYFYGNFYSKSLRLVYVNPDLAIEKPDFIYNGWQGYYKELKGDKDIEITEFVKTLSDEIKVAADNFFAPHVSGRRYIYHLKNYKWADIIIDRKSNNAVYEGFSIVKETKLWKIYKKDKNNL